MQRSGRVNRGNQRNSLVKGLLLLFVFAAILFFYRNLRKDGLPSHLSSMFSGEFENYRNLKALDSTQVDSIKKEFAGFWVYTTGDSTSAVRVTEMLELQKSGIIWEVIRWDLRFLTADSVTLYQIRHCYLNPYSLSSDTSDVICDIRVLRQSFIIGEDTCYGTSQVDNMWRARRIGDEFELSRKRFKRYNGSLESFFPHGMIDLVDKVDLSECKGATQLTPFAKNFLEKIFLETDAVILPDNRKIIYDYYDTFLKAELIESLPYLSSIDDSIPLMITVNPDGVVQDASIPNQVVLQSKLQEVILKEALAWKFPSRQSGVSTDVRYLLKF
ncbi:MAG: hypothetical protein JW915_20430 [Chitinispirillaceae bacterium]|nr:hypothetical protein [Chitinispirillaceae bacterium]